MFVVGDNHEEDMITETEAKKHGIPVRFIYEVIRAKTDLNFYNAVKETYACGEKLYMLNERCIVSREKLPSTIEKRWMNDFKSVDDFKRFPWEKYSARWNGNSRTVREFDTLPYNRSVYQVSPNGEMPEWSMVVIPASNLNSCEGIRCIED